jgi:hypothetical protein
MMTKWLPADQPNTLPPNASHQVGVGAIVVNDEQQLLVVQEANGPLRGAGFWKMPTGLVHAGVLGVVACVRALLACLLARLLACLLACSLACCCVAQTHTTRRAPHHTTPPSNPLVQVRTSSMRWSGRCWRRRGCTSSSSRSSLCGRCAVCALYVCVCVCRHVKACAGGAGCLLSACMSGLCARLTPRCARASACAVSPCSCAGTRFCLWKV